jgi:hypothetical protein
MGFELSGADSNARELRNNAEEWSEPARYYVGTNVEYAIYLEYGTSKMDPKPFFRPVIAEARRDLNAFIRDNTDFKGQNIDSPDKLVKVVAFAIERRVKEVITEKGLIDTGAMRASVRATKAPGELPDAEEVDPDAEQDISIDL